MQIGKWLLVLAVLGFAPLPSIAQTSTDTYFYTPNGGGVNGAVGMCLNQSGKAVPCSFPNVTPSPTSSAYAYNVVGSTITRPADTTAYAANETVCAAKTVTPCVPGTIQIANLIQGNIIGIRVSMLKSGSTTTNATFTLWLYSAAPVLTSPTQFDSTSYTGPRAADMPNYIGNAACNTPAATSDATPQVWYDCTLSNPNISGALIAQALSGSKSIDYLLTSTAAGGYNPASAETFTPYMSGIY